MIPAPDQHSITLISPAPACPVGPGTCTLNDRQRCGFIRGGMHWRLHGMPCSIAITRGVLRAASGMPSRRVRQRLSSHSQHARPLERPHAAEASCCFVLLVPTPEEYRGKRACAFDQPRIAQGPLPRTPLGLAAAAGPLWARFAAAKGPARPRKTHFFRPRTRPPVAHDSLHAGSGTRG